MTIRTVPAHKPAIPNKYRPEMRSRNMIAENATVTSIESLSMGTTTDAGPSWSAR